MNAKKWNHCRDPERMLTNLVRRMESSDSRFPASLQICERSISRFDIDFDPPLRRQIPSQRKFWLFGLACCEASLNVTARMDIAQSVGLLEELITSPQIEAKRKLRDLRAIGKNWSCFNNQSHGLAVFRKLFKAIVRRFDPEKPYDEYATAFQQDVRIYRRIFKRSGTYLRIAPDREGTCDLIREIFGYSNEPIPFESSWINADVTWVASRIYEEKRFGELPILGDALEEAGCDSEEVLSHCRDVPNHTRGCWLLDLVLGFG